LGGGNGESITNHTNSSRYTNITETYQRPGFVVYHTVEVRMYPNVQGRMCTPTEQTICKKPRTQIYANKGSMTTARKQSLRAVMGRAIKIFFLRFESEINRELLSSF